MHSVETHLAGASGDPFKLCVCVSSCINTGDSTQSDFFFWCWKEEDIEEEEESKKIRNEGWKRKNESELNGWKVYGMGEVVVKTSRFSCCSGDSQRSFDM